MHKEFQEAKSGLEYNKSKGFENGICPNLEISHTELTRNSPFRFLQMSLFADIIPFLELHIVSLKHRL